MGQPSRFLFRKENDPQASRNLGALRNSGHLGLYRFSANNRIGHPRLNDHSGNSNQSDAPLVSGTPAGSITKLDDIRVRPFADPVTLIDFPLEINVPITLFVSERHVWIESGCAPCRKGT